MQVGDSPSVIVWSLCSIQDVLACPVLLLMMALLFGLLIGCRFSQ